MADLIYFYVVDSKTRISNQSLQIALRAKFFDLRWPSPRWIQATLKQFLAGDIEIKNLNFLQDAGYELGCLTTGSSFSSAEILHNMRVARPDEWGLHTDNQYLHHFWQLDANASQQAASVIDRVIDSALAQRLDPSSLLGEFAYVDTPTTREQLKAHVDPIQQSDADSTTYFLDALNSLLVLLKSVKASDSLVVNSIEFVPVVVT
jgi:hypothetical protein